MNKPLQALVIAVACVAMFIGVYLIAPAGPIEGTPVAGAADSKLAASGAAADGRLADPLAPSERGLVECHQPNDQRKTCRSMSTYEALGGGRYRDTTVALVSGDGPMLLEVSLPVTVKSGAACVTMSPSIYTKGRLVFAGRVLSSSEAAPVLASIPQQMKRYMNKEVCTSYVSSFGELTAVATIEGVPQPDLNSRLKWVRPEDGYTVAP